MNAVAPARETAKAIVDEIADDIKLALPSNIPIERFRATFMTAVAHNPEILRCEPQSVRNALLKAATDRLMPDGREAALVPFNTKVKQPDGGEVWMLLAQYMPMVLGIRKRAKELGGVVTLIAEPVYDNDSFDYQLGDEPFIEHKPVKLGQDRGNVIGAYAIFKDDEDHILHREVMSRQDIERARSVSRAKNGPAWSNWYDEMARKTAVRRGAKSVPNMPDELRQIIERDDEYVDLTAQSMVAQRQSNPLLEDQSNTGAQSGPTAKPTSPGSKASAQPADIAGGSGPALSAGQTQVSSSSSQDESGDDNGGEDSGNAPLPRLPSETFTSYSQALARYSSEENLQKGHDKFWSDKGGKPENARDFELAKVILNTHGRRIKEGKPTLEEIAAQLPAVINQSYEDEL